MLNVPDNMRVPRDVRKSLQCPVCHGELVHIDDYLKCGTSTCGNRFPIVDGIPVLINNQSSIFEIDDFTKRRNTTYRLNQSGLRKKILKLLPTLSNNLASRRNYSQFARLLEGQSSAPRVLVIGGSIVGAGMHGLLDLPAIQLIESDVSFGPRTTLICDAHDIPFQDNSIDGVIAQAVLEHVLDPYRCVQEIHRVLKPNGLIYAETPFMQQVHAREYDFTRFTHLGHRRLFRRFEEIDSGVACGPAMALAWSYQYLLLSFTKSPTLRRLLIIFSRFTAFWLKYLDYLLVNTAGAVDAASGLFFLGRKSDKTLCDKELLRLYRGAFD
jgi:SAM-dependent methyltransferase/uncharacterized protein YbaR (Trm112 family)